MHIQVSCRIKYCNYFFFSSYGGGSSSKNKRRGKSFSNQKEITFKRGNKAQKCKRKRQKQENGEKEGMGGGGELRSRSNIG